MTTLHVLRVFVGPDRRGGNPLGVFLDGGAIPEGRRQAIATQLGFSETVFVDDAASGSMRIFLPTEEAAFAGHPVVGTAWLLGWVGIRVTALSPPIGTVPVRGDGSRTWIRARADWSPGRINLVQLGSAAEVDAHAGQQLGEPWLYVWAWEDESAGIVRSRSFPTNFGILEDEASGSASVVIGDRLHRALTIRQGVGSEIRVRPHHDGTVEVGGLVDLVETRRFD